MPEGGAAALVFDTSAILNFGQRDDLQPILKLLAAERKLITTPDVVAELTDPEKQTFNRELLRENFEIQAPKTDVFDLATLRKLAEAIHQGEIWKFQSQTLASAISTSLRRGTRINVPYVVWMLMTKSI